MIRIEGYEWIAKTFGISVGVANILGYKKREEAKDEFPTEVGFKKFNDELDINYIITDAIEVGKYRELQRELYRLNQKRTPQIKELTIYKKAWKETYGKNNKSKSKQV
jgi:hypothetical protein